MIIRVMATRMITRRFATRMIIRVRATRMITKGNATMMINSLGWLAGNYTLLILGIYQLAGTL